MPKLAGENKCTGCSACYSICSKKAIHMLANKEGFAYPQIDSSKCISCGLCERVCPIINPNHQESIKPASYLIQNKNELEREESTSGGAFSLIAKYVINRGGVVFGVCIDESFSVKHISVEKIEHLNLFRNSKYVQSNVGESFKDAYHCLSNNKPVLFSGTPCQINGLKAFLDFKKCDTNLLITIDVICHAVPSPLLFKKYIDFKARKYSFDKIVFRDKKYGYSCSCLSLFKNDKRVYSATSQLDEYMRLFLNNIGLRKSCYMCESQPFTHNSDFTLWDCWNPNALSSKKHDNRGTTNLIAWSAQARRIIQEIDSSCIVTKVPFEKQYPGERKHVFALKEDRERFFDDLNELPLSSFFNKYTPVTFRIWFKEKIRLFLVKIHLHDVVRKIVLRSRSK